MKADQAIFTSLARRGKAGYHLVAKSDGLTPGEESAVATWSPSHGGFSPDPINRVSVNYQLLPSGRFSLSRTVEGPSEYSGRGGRQLYTHHIIISTQHLKNAGYRPFAIYRDALAQGFFIYRPEPSSRLEPVELSMLHSRNSLESWGWLIREFGRAQFESLVYQLEAERPVVVPFEGNRAQLTEALLSRLDPVKVSRISFATNLQPSSMRPVLLQLVAR